jgi:PQQ-dependent catabolism-associated CXXCW motif protein
MRHFTSIRGLAAAAFLTATALFSPPAGAAGVPEPQGYRMSQFRAPVPASLTGGKVVSLGQVQALVEAGEVVLIDVLPRPPKPKGLKEGTIWRPRPRHNIPGSVWLPNTGFGALSDEVEDYFRGSLERLSGGDKDRGLLFYCLADCWMSWNAAKRAITYGYRKVLWFPEGTDAWTATGRPTEASEPLPGWQPGSK